MHLIMKEKETYSYTFEEYKSDLGSLKYAVSGIKSLHLIAVYRGSVPLTVHLSNLLKCEMSIIKLETKNGNVEEANFVSNNIKDNDRLVVLEDIYDTGNTIRLIQQMMNVKYKDHSIRYYSLFG
ncbi:MAG: phosphoribosyltransferase, partial [Nitrospina sp.]|nr:phosphoribosyltransferase [Nitrospina sp.]